LTMMMMTTMMMTTTFSTFSRRGSRRRTTERAPTTTTGTISLPTTGRGRSCRWISTLTPWRPRRCRPPRRRGSAAGPWTRGGADGKRRATQRRKSSLVTDSLSTWQRLAQLKQSAYHAQLVLGKIDTSLAKVSKKELEDLVGDELQQAFRENTRFQQQIVEQRKLLHEIAVETHGVEEDCLRYLPWLERATQQDTDDVKFCDELIAKIRAFQRIHPSIRRAREQRLEEERLRQLEQEKLEEERRRQEEDKRFREAALAKETEAKPGMVWNPSTREYQALNTDESWRD
jgi:hypothetical protein